MENLEFSEEEIQEQLALLGYKNIPKHRLLEFKQDLKELVRHGQWNNVAPATLINTKTQTSTSQSSPPAYIKEKVSASYIEGSGNGFFLHAQRTNHDRKSLTTHENRNHGWQQGCCESYAQHSVALKRQLPPSAPNRLQAEHDTEDSLDSLLSDSYTSSSDLQQRCFIKRKVLRKHKGKSFVCDESVYSEDSERSEREKSQHLSELSHSEDRLETDDSDDSSSNKDIKFIDSQLDLNCMTHRKMCVDWKENLRQRTDVVSCLEEQMAELDLCTSAQKDYYVKSEDVTDQSETPSSDIDGVSLSALESYIRGMTRPQSDGDVRPKPKSFIRPVMSQQTAKKTDPVAKYFQYKHIWEMFKLPGENDRKALRWEIKERLAYQPPPPKPRRVYVPNTYTVPTEKKRSALRWQIRNDLANGLLPQRFNYQF